MRLLIALSVTIVSILCLIFLILSFLGIQHYLESEKNSSIINNEKGQGDFKGRVKYPLDSQEGEYDLKGNYTDLFGGNRSTQFPSTRETRQLVRLQKLKPVQDEVWFDEKPTNHRFRHVNGVYMNNSVPNSSNLNSNPNPNTNSDGILYGNLSSSGSSSGNGPNPSLNTTTNGSSILNHDSGHFRHRIATIWDPHPKYNFRAFGIDFNLKLKPSEDTFENVDVTTHDGNYTQKKPTGIGGCFYNGVVEGDRLSSVAVSLCHGMTGHIRTSNGSFFIEPAEEWKGPSSSLLHVIYQIYLPTTTSTSSTSDYLEPVHKLQMISTGKNASEKADGSSDKEKSFELNIEDNLQIDGKSRKRVKRSMSRETYVELMVVTDSTMTAYHGSNLKHYVLTLLSIVSLVYRDVSIGNPVNIALVKFHVLKDKDFASKSGNRSSGISAAEMLRNFCKWQKEMNDFEEHSAHHHDVALLLTRETICRNPWLSKCDTLGLAELGTMCDHYASCAIVQDNGLSAAFTMSHELGHILNMPHDDDYKCNSFISKTRHAHYVMSRMLDQNTYPWAWSRCSRHYLTEFLDAGHGHCLEDKPSSNLLERNPLSNNQPGEIFTEHDQCQLVFGPTSKLCSYMPVCRRLWCTSSEETEGCRTQHMPWADGTPCGKSGEVDKWCQRGQCVPRDLEKLRVVDGNWGFWQGYGECSRTCGGGVRKSMRECDNPAPSNGGRYCIGPRIRYESCNPQECNSTTIDFRAEQCSQFNHDNFNIQGLPKNGVEWVPKYTGISPKDRCKLFCRVLGSSAYYLLREKVVDGTTCGPDTFDICVNGACLPAGCDRRLYSRKTLDICGVCGGDGGTCKTLGGAYNESKYGYSEVVRIPAGASSLDVRQTGWENSAKDDNYLAIMDPATGENLLNGNFVVSMFRKTVHAAGTILEYSGSDSVVERINSSRPLRSELIIQVLSVGKLHPPDIRFQYVISIKSSYKWTSSQWSPCSNLCEGNQVQKQICVQTSDQQQVDEVFCSASTNKPPEFQRVCNDNCRLKWVCSCGDDGVKRLSCIQEFAHVNQSVVGDENCASIGRSSANADCPCPSQNVINYQNTVQNSIQNSISSSTPTWVYGTWSECSSPCGEGFISRSVVCPNSQSGCEGFPLAKKKCYGDQCGNWRIEEWSPCSRSCGVGRIKGLYACYLGSSPMPPNYCIKEPKPVVERLCEGPPCYTWEIGQWNECICPGGFYNRTVVCKSELNLNIVDDFYCQEQNGKPEEVRSCACAYREKDPEINFHPKSSPLVWNEWVIGNWSECDGSNIKRRKIFCSAPPCLSRRPEEIQECGIWWTGGWGRCNSTCGEGVETRLVRCIDKNRRDLPEIHCKGSTPEKTRTCVSIRCEKRKRGFESWIVGDWGECSKPCNTGIISRSIICPNNNCNPEVQPKNQSGCNEEKCIWKTHDWSQCKQCTKSRKVECLTVNGTLVSTEFCFENEMKPNETDKCECKARWKVGQWTNCTKKCGKGFKNRTLACYKGGKPVNETVCLTDLGRKPKVTRKCRGKCPVKWVTSHWSECSKSCGYGIQMRNVTCHRVNQHDWVDPEEIKNGCEHLLKPKTYNYCITSECGSEYTWFTSKWTDCPKNKCGKVTRQRRQVHCIRASNGIKVAVELCKSESRPQKKRKCPFKQCGHHSCAEIRSLRDGEYTVLVGGKNMSIYCHNMAGGFGAGHEFLSLKYPSENFAEVYSKRLIRPETCPRGGTRMDTCECVEDKNRKSGKTIFQKIRINITNLSIDPEDFTFARSVGSNIPFGHSGDCYSSVNCPQGKFSINLNGTGLRVAESVTWISHGHKAAMWINKNENSTKIEGKCGGYCGSCTPNTIKLTLP